MRNKIFTGLTVLLIQLIILSISGCSSYKSNNNAENPDIRNLHQEEKFNSYSINLSTGGGFTGLKSGYALFSNGVVTRWQKLPTGKDLIDWKVKVDSSQIEQFRKELELTGITDRQYTETGNITAYLKYKTVDTTYFWSWKGIGVNSNIPPEIKVWYIKVNLFCSELH